MVVAKWIKGTDNLSDPFSIRTEVFIMEQGFEDEFDDIDKVASHICLYDGERAVGAGRIFKEGQSETYHLGRICILKEYRGQNLGDFLVREMVKKAAKLGGKRCILGAQTRAREFYEKIGFVTFGEEYMDEHCPHIMMEMAI